MQAFKSTEESDYGAYDMCEEEPMAYESINASAMMGMTASNDWDGDFIEWNTEEYSYQPENQWISVRTNAFSTFAADVDTASYANVRRMLTRQQQVPVDAVRLEEMINYFHYDYPQPKAGEPFSVTTEMAPCPWNDNAKLLMIGVAAPELDTSERANSNLVFLIDVSGSMDGEDRLGLVQRSFKLLCEELRPGDRVSIVTYANGDRVVLEGATGDEKSVITDAIEDLFASGGTNGSAGIQTAYSIAEKYFIEGGNNRIILATDGDLNIGITDEGSLTRLIEEKAKSGVFLSVLGFGWGNISDTRMEALADHGNGNYSYIDSIAEARKVLIEEMGSTLFTVAKDVKLQVEFNPDMVKGYRLIGYENRVMSATDFADDTKDGGEIGAGHQVTALYEIALKDSAQEIPEVESRYGNDKANEQTRGNLSEEYLTVNVRYKEPDGDTSKLLVYPVTAQNYREQMSENLSWAAGVAQAGMLLKKSEYAGTSQLKNVISRMKELDCAHGDEYREEFLYLFGRIQID
ncbi:MAG: VWA domain-containing protein [Lachnospiraceae bacterium]|nr:VWA domain-containing protein [Lachnospiraceae bacterium]